MGLGEGQAAPHREDAGAGLQGWRGFAKGGRLGARLWAAWAAERSRAKAERRGVEHPVLEPSAHPGEPGRQARLWAEGPGAQPRAGLKSAGALGGLAQTRCALPSAASSRES